MRVAIVAECFTPTWNGVTGSVLRVLEHLDRSGHQALVIAPGPWPARSGAAAVERVPALTLPAYRTLPIGLPTAAVGRAIEAFAPDVVHLAAPVLLGDAGGLAAARLGVPVVAVYQTDLAGFARRYGGGCGVGGLAGGLIWAWLRRVHGRAAVTLAPSSTAEWELRRHGIGPVARWARGVDLDRFHPRHRSGALHRRLLGPGGRLLVGYAGRLAPEKQVHQLRVLSRLPGVRLAVIGDGPARARLARQLPGATFLGYQSGAALSQAVASLDVFVHPGRHETFCQAVQEAMASGVPVVAPAAGGPLDLVQHGLTGWLYPAGEPEVMREAVLALAGDPALRARMGAAARASVRDRGWAGLGDELLGYYRAVLPGGAAGHAVGTGRGMRQAA
jgi:phosphatidylinositol alpha 1,6-mannosyltransferase